MKTDRMHLTMPVIIVLGVLVAGCMSESTKYPGEPVGDAGRERTKSGVTYFDLVRGTGEEAKDGDRVAVHYTGYLTDSTRFDSSHDRQEPLVFRLGSGMVIKGWDEGVAGMQVGGKRKLVVPSHLGYGDRGIVGVIPPHATLIFDVELTAVQR